MAAACNRSLACCSDGDNNAGAGVSGATAIGLATLGVMILGGVIHLYATLATVKNDVAWIKRTLAARGSAVANENG